MENIHKMLGIPFRSRRIRLSDNIYVILSYIINKKQKNTTFVANDSTQLLDTKNYFRVKPYERNDKGYICAMYKDINKN